MASSTAMPGFGRGATDSPSIDRDTTEQNTTRARNMVSTAVQFGIALMIAILMMLVTGLFVVNVPTSGAFSEAINTTVDIGGAGFIILAVTLLVVPVVGVIAYFRRSGLAGLGGGQRR